MYKYLILSMILMGQLGAVQAKDVLSDSQEGRQIGGIFARKGTIAATMANACEFNRLVEIGAPITAFSSIEEDQKELLDSLKAIGLFEFFPVHQWFEGGNEGRAFVAILYLERYPEEGKATYMKSCSAQLKHYLTRSS